MWILIHDYAGHPFQLQLSRELARRGHTVTHAYAGGLVTPRGDLCRRADDSPGFDAIEVPMASGYRRNKYSFLKRRGYEVAYGRELAALVRKLRPDIILSANTPTEPQWSMIEMAQRLGMPVITWLQDFYSIAVDKLARKKLPLVGALAGAWYRHLDAKCFRASAGIVAITEDFLPILAGFGVPADKVTVIPNWAPLDELPLKPRRNNWSTRQGLDGKFVFLYSGTLAMKHNPDLLRQLAVQFGSDPAVQVVVISEGPGAEYLQVQKSAENLTNLTLLPFQSFADMPEVLASGDVLVAVLEPDAGVFSVPSKVLTYHCVGRALLAAIPRENLAARIIARQGSGICVSPDDIAGFGAAAAALRADAPRRDEMARCARRYAEGDFAIGRIADQFEAAIGRAGTGRLKA